MRCRDLEETHLGVEDSHPLARSGAAKKSLVLFAHEMDGFLGNHSWDIQKGFLK